MSWVNLISELLHFDHPVFVVDFDVGLGSSNYKAASITGVIDSVILLLFIEHYVLNRVSFLGGPSHNATIKASTEKFLLVHRFIIGWLPRQ